MPAEKHYTSFLRKINRLRSKEITVLSLTHLLRFLTICGGVLFITLLLESIFWLPAGRRILLSIITGAASLVLLAVYISAPFKAWTGRDRRYGLESLCLNIGKTYPEIRDRLLNSLQLYRELSHNSRLYSPALIEETMNRSGASFSGYDFERSIDYLRLKRHFSGFAVFLIALTGFLFLFPGALGSAFSRVIHPAAYYPPPASFSMDILPGDTEIIRNEPFHLTVSVTGETPESMSVFIKREDTPNFEEYPLERNGELQYTYTREKVKESFNYFIQGREHNGLLFGNSVESDIYHVQVIHRPMVRKLKLHLDYPAYSQLGSRYLEDNIGDITALKGTGVRIELTLNKTAADAEIRFDSGEAIPCNVSGSTAQAVFRIMSSSRYSIHLTDGEGITNDEPIEYRISSIPDADPYIQIVVPGKDTDLTEDKQLPLGMKLSDDFGLSGLRLGYRLIDRDEIEAVLAPENKDKLLSNPSSFTYIDLPLDNKQGVMQDLLLIWDMKNIQIFPEDQVMYFAELFDNDRISGPKMTRSGVYMVRLPSIEELFEQAAEIQEEQEERLTDILEEGKDLQQDLKEIAQDLMQATELDWEEKQKTEEAVRKQEELRRQMEDIKKEIDQLVEKFETNDLLSADVLDKYKELQELLQELSTQEMQEVMQKLQEALENMQDLQQNRRSLEDFRAMQEDYLSRVERTVNILKRLQIEQMVDELVTKSENITETQEMINAQTDSLISQTSEQTQETQEEAGRNQREGSEKLSRQEEDLAQRYDNLKETLEKTLEKMTQQPDISSEKLEELSEKMEYDELSEEMMKMSGELFRQALRQSLNRGEAIARELENIEENLKEAQEELTESQKQEILAEMMNAAESLNRLSKNQEDIRTKSSNLTPNSNQYTEIADEQNNLMSGLNRTIGRLVRLSEKTFFLTPELGGKLGETANSMQTAINNLEARDKNGTQAQQQNSMKTLNEATLMLREAMNNAQQSGSGTGFSEFMQRMEQLSGQQQGVNQGTLDALQGDSRSMEQQSMMERLARQQEMIRRSLEELRQEMQGKGSVEDRLGQMGGDMQEVEKQMHDQNVTDRTLELQRRILSRMLDAQRSVHRRDFSQKRYSETALFYEPVDPGALPENLGESGLILKESLIRALKEGYSKDFEDLIRKYFENLNKLNVIKGKDIKK
ncbi:DUF4175 family protein [candidate division KSB1 bacterium]